MERSSGKPLEDISQAHIVSSFCEPISSAKDSDDLSFGSDHRRNRGRDELTSNKNLKGKYQLRIMLKDVFGFAENQEKSTYGSGYKLPLTRNKDDAVIDEAARIADARIKIDHIHWYLHHYTSPIHLQGILSKQISSKAPTELR